MKKYFIELCDKMKLPDVRISRKLSRITIITAIFGVHQLTAQYTISQVLDEIRYNNKTIQVNTQYFAVQRMQYKSGNTPANPQIEYDFLSGSPANAGNQHEFTVFQQFDFPTVYSIRSKVTGLQTEQTEFQLTAIRQDVLLETKNICLDIIHKNKLNALLYEQKENAERILNSLQRKLDAGDGNILDVNKAKLYLTGVKKDLQLNISELQQLHQKLAELNGGSAIVFTDSLYPAWELIPSFDILENEYENADPVLKNLKQQKRIAEKQIGLSKALKLPRFELGYHYQGILGQRYHGIHTAVSLPLWEHKNVVKTKEAQLLFADLELDAHVHEHYYHIKHIYEKYVNLKIILEEHSLAMRSVKPEVLGKAFDLGELSTIEYFTELNHYNTALMSFLEIEKEFHQTIAELYKYKL